MRAAIDELGRAARVAAGLVCDADRDVCRLENELASARERRALLERRRADLDDAFALVVAVHTDANCPAERPGRG